MGLAQIQEIIRSITDMAKVRPSNLFLRPLDLFYNQKFFQKMSIKASKGQ